MSVMLSQKLHAVHSGFHSDLVRSCTVPRDGATTGNITIADCFITWKEKLLVYGEFCSNLPRAQDLLDRLCEAKPIISERVTVCLTLFFYVSCTADSTRRSFSFRNKLPAAIREAGTLDTFKCRLQTHLTSL